jgi:AraC family transcriptional regulator
VDWLDKMNGALDYIENNLNGEIHLEEVARRACCSSFNFQRMFSFMADVSLADYIRRRRLSMAAMELLTTGEKIIDVALKYGYESPVSFARAFYAVHGMNPSEVRRSGRKIKSYPCISFEITIKGAEAMNYCVKELGEFRLVGIKERMTMDTGENFKRIPKFWNEFYNQSRCKEMLKFNDNKDLLFMGVCANSDDKGFDYYIATGSNQEIPEDMAELVVPAGKYVIFECVGSMPEGQQKVWKRIFTEWFPSSGYEMADGPQLEWYSEGDITSEEYRSEIWIPVHKKA